MPPSENMRLDEAMLAREEPALLRVYGWSPPGLSIGRFQDPRGFADVEGDHEIVRRVTGGGAIYHDDELTFALAVDAELLPASIPESYALVHRAVQQALADVGVPTEIVTNGAPCGARPAQRWCFQTPGQNDLVTRAGRKIVGSAQRRVRLPRARVLHHGSIVLTAPRQTPFCGAVADVVDPREVERELASALVARIAAIAPV